MATILLPATADSPFYDFEVELEGAIYTIELRWNERADLWFLSLYDATGAPISQGRAAVLGVDLVGRTADARRPPGTIFVWDSANNDEEAGRYDLGGRVQLLYAESQ